MQRGMEEVLCWNPKRASIKKLVKCAAQWKVQHLMIKAQQWFKSKQILLEWKINELWAMVTMKGPSPCGINGEAPLAEQPSALSCSPRPAPPPCLLSPSSIPAHPHWGKQAQNVGEKRKMNDVGDTERCQESALKAKAQPGQGSLWRAQRNPWCTKCPQSQGKGWSHGPEAHPTEKSDYSHTSRLNIV